MTHMTPAPAHAAKPDSFTAVMDLWPTIAKFAAAVGQPRQRVYKWYENRRIDLVHWQVVIEACRRDHGVALAIDDLYAMALAVPDGRTRPEPSSQEAA